jgi:PAS domain S-box-containing protein
VVKRVPGKSRAPLRERQTPAVTARQLLEAFLKGPVAAGVARGDRVLRVNHPFAAAVGRERAGCEGLALADLLPPEPAGPVELPEPGRPKSYRTRLDGVAARVDLSASGRGDRRLVGFALRPILDAPDTAQSRTLLALSRELAAAQGEEELATALERALDALFPSRSFCLRLVDARTLAAGAFRARGPLPPPARQRLALRRSAVKKTGLSEPVLRARGLAVTEADEPIFEGCRRAIAVPLAASGELYGVLNLEYGEGAPGAPETDEPLLLQVANQAALAVRNLRSLREVTYLKGFLEDLLENANALIAVVNRERKVIVFNRALSSLVGRPREEALGGELAALVPERERRSLRALLDRTFAGEAVAGVELRLSLATGGEASAVVNTSAIYGASGAVEGILIVGQDQTLLRAFQDRAEHAQKLAELGRLAAGIVHELNNPLTAVTAYADALVRKLSAQGHDEADVQKLRSILDAGERIQRFSRDLIAYARPPREKLESVDLAGVMRQAAQMCEPALRDAKATLEHRLEAVPAVRGVRGSLLQVFVNLVTNAAHALEPRGGVVRLELARAGGRVAARVKDDGPGMTAEVKGRAFEPFFTTKAAGKGSGLGLSIVQGIVARHGGAVEVESAPGEGSTFTVTLPVEEPR